MLTGTSTPGLAIPGYTIPGKPTVILNAPPLSIHGKLLPPDWTARLAK